MYHLDIEIPNSYLSEITYIDENVDPRVFRCFLSAFNAYFVDLFYRIVLEVRNYESEER